MSLLELLPPRDSAASRRLEARAGGALIAFGGAVSIAMSGLDPMPEINILAGAVGLALAFAALLSPLDGVKHWVYVGISAAVTLLVSSVPASIHRPGDLGTGPIFLVCVVLHASVFMSRRQSALLTGWNCVVYGVVVLDELPLASALAAWVTTAAALTALQVSTATLREGIDGLVAQLQVQAEHDGLTGLLNRQGLVERIKAGGEDATGALLVLDVDHFKHINDRYGHATGDATLSWLGALLDSEARATGDVRENDLTLPRAVPARFGGEEFVVWLRGADQVDGAAWAERLREQVQIGAQSRLWPVTISIGVAGGRCRDLVEILNRADHALYQAKRDGRNAVRVAAEAGPVEV
jgi:diguanylate cyclase (GGDEF)-like protein